MKKQPQIKNLVAILLILLPFLTQAQDSAILEKYYQIDSAFINTGNGNRDIRDSIEIRFTDNKHFIIQDFTTNDIIRIELGELIESEQAISNQGDTLYSLIYMAVANEKIKINFSIVINDRTKRLHSLGYESREKIVGMLVKYPKIK